MKVLGIVLMVLALGIGVLPQFTDCQSQGKAIELANGKTVPMKCHWTARAELALAGPLLAVGGVVTGSRRRETRRMMGLMGVILGAFVIALPTQLIGVCSSQMLCNLVMKPALILGGSVTMAVGAVVAFQARKAVGVLQAEEKVDLAV